MATRFLFDFFSLFVILLRAGVHVSQHDKKLPAQCLYKKTGVHGVLYYISLHFALCTPALAEYMTSEYPNQTSYLYCVHDEVNMLPNMAMSIQSAIFTHISGQKHRNELTSCLQQKYTNRLQIPQKSI